MKITVAAFLAFAGLLGCQESSFEGDSDKSKVEGKKEVKEQAVPEPGDSGATDEYAPPENCTEAGATLVKLLTDSITNGAENQFVKYELTLVDCDGRPKPLQGAAILFDFNASIFPLNANINYDIETAAKQKLLSGTLQAVSGSDLFGNQGPLYFHWKTGEVNLDPSESKVYLSINISGLTFGPPNSITPPKHEFQIASYLRFGDAAPIEQPLTFKPKG